MSAAARPGDGYHHGGFQALARAIQACIDHGEMTIGPDGRLSTGETTPHGMHEAARVDAWLEGRPFKDIDMASI